jgi:hypothetical protein
VGSASAFPVAPGAGCQRRHEGAARVPAGRSLGYTDSVMPIELTLGTGGAGGEFSPRKRRRKAPDVKLTSAAVTSGNHMDRLPP